MHLSLHLRWSGKHACHYIIATALNSLVDWFHSPFFLISAHFNYFISFCRRKEKKNRQNPHFTPHLCLFLSLAALPSLSHHVSAGENSGVGFSVRWRFLIYGTCSQNHELQFNCCFQGDFSDIFSHCLALSLETHPVEVVHGAHKHLFAHNFFFFLRTYFICTRFPQCI